jgi:hypothetical protein
MHDIASAAGIRAVVVGVGLCRGTEDFPPTLSTMKSKGMMDGVAGFVTQESKAFGLGSSLDLEDLGALESLSLGCVR